MEILKLIAEELRIKISDNEAVATQQVLLEIRRIKQENINASWEKYPDRMGQ